MSEFTPLIVFQAPLHEHEIDARLVSSWSCPTAPSPNDEAALQTALEGFADSTWLLKAKTAGIDGKRLFNGTKFALAHCDAAPGKGDDGKGENDDDDNIEESSATGPPPPAAVVKCVMSLALSDYRMTVANAALHEVLYDEPELIDSYFCDPNIAQALKQFVEGNAQPFGLLSGLPGSGDDDSEESDDSEGFGHSARVQSTPLSNHAALGIESVLVTSDGHCVFFHRSLSVASYPGYWCCPGGHPEPSKVFGEQERSTQHENNRDGQQQACGSDHSFSFDRRSSPEQDKEHDDERGAEQAIDEEPHASRTEHTLSSVPALVPPSVTSAQFRVQMEALRRELVSDEADDVNEPPGPDVDDDPVKQTDDALHQNLDDLRRNVTAREKDGRGRSVGPAIIAELFQSALDEVHEEIGLDPETLTNRGFCGVALDDAGGKPDAMFIVDTSLSKGDVDLVFKQRIMTEAFESNHEAGLAFVDVRTIKATFVDGSNGVSGVVGGFRLTPASMACVALCAPHL